MTHAALHISSGDLVADRRFEYARGCADDGDFAAAADLLMQTLELAPRYASAWFLLGEVREKSGDRAGAIEAFGKARDADPQDRHGAALHLMRLGASEAGEMPADYVRSLFDGYADRFDTALTDGLNYRGPELLYDAVLASGRAMSFERVLDLGCGTGLAGETFRVTCDRLVGVDLSPGMIAKAEAKTLYDHLVTGDVLAFLGAEAAEQRAYHLILAADVFVYMKNLDAVVAAAERVMSASGLLAFSVETHDGEGVVLRDTLRYAHSEAVVRAAIERARLSVVLLTRASTRTEKGVPVPGLVVVADRT